MKLHTGTMVTGILYLAIGLGFVLEALGMWTMSLADLKYLLPLALVTVGLAVVVGSLSHGRGEVG